MALWETEKSCREPHNNTVARLSEGCPCLSGPLRWCHRRNLPQTPGAAHLGHVTAVKMLDIRTSYLIIEPHLTAQSSVNTYTILDVYSISIIRWLHLLCERDLNAPHRLLCLHWYTCKIIHKTDYLVYKSGRELPIHIRCFMTDEAAGDGGVCVTVGI